MIPYVDLHTHQFYGDLPSILSIRNCIISKDYFQQQICSVGIHPWYVDQDFDQQMDTLKVFAAKNNALAIGECGLDKVCSTPWESQMTAFKSQLQLAQELNKPLILHTVRAFQETLTLLTSQQPRVPIIFHGFNKHQQLANDLVQKGYYVSLGTDILKGRLDAIIKDLPLAHIFLETDDKNTSIKEIYTYFCGVRKIGVEQLKQQLYSNFCTTFNY